MAKRRGTRRRRSTRQRIRRASRKLTPGRILSGILAFSPVSIKAYGDFQKTGGGVNGIMKGALPAVSQSFTGINPIDGKFRADQLQYGLLPVAIVIGLNKFGFSRLVNRVL